MVAAAFAVQAVRGLGIAALDVAATTLVQRNVPRHLLGRVFGTLYGGIGVAAAFAYLLGGLQIHSIRKELVDSKQMTEKQFHDEVMRQRSMPIAFLRLAVTKQKLTRETQVPWKFYGEVAAPSPPK